LGQIAKNNRLNSYYESESNFTPQELRVMQCLNMNITDAWSISAHTGIMITSVRRCLTDLQQAGYIEETGSVYNEFTKRNVTTYKVIKNKQATLF
jgi:DNA-binding MarR family transcriptional regulator